MVSELELQTEAPSSEDCERMALPVYNLDRYRLASRAITEGVSYLSQGRVIPPVSGIAQACFDESGKLHDSAVVSFGGCLFLSSVMDAFTKKWVARLSLDNVPYTSMKEAIHFHGPYLPFKDDSEKRDNLICDLAQIIIDAPVIRVSAAIRTEHFKALAPEFRKKLKNDPQYAMFESVILGALQGSTHPQGKVGLHIVCDLSEDFSERCVSLFHVLRSRHLDVRDRCYGIAFIDDEAHAGLQAADMVAYCARAEAMADICDPHPLVRTIIDRFAIQGRLETEVLYKIEGSGLGDAMLPKAYNEGK